MKIIKKKAVIFPLVISILFLSIVLIFDVFGNIVFFISKGYPVWQRFEVENFRVRGFAERVDDSRFFTAKPNYGKDIPNSDIVMDGFGFRQGLNSLRPDVGTIVFIGDSVPFGWNLPGDHSVPSQFHSLLAKEYGVPEERLSIINAALPSYSQRQSISRYRKEIKDRFPVSLVVLQTYEPAVSFAMFGRQWNPDDNWANRGVKLNEIKNSLYEIRSVFKYSSIYYAWSSRIYDKRDPRLTYRIQLSDKAAFERFRSLVFKELGDFVAELGREGIPLVLLPVVIPRENVASGPRLVHTRKAFIDALRDFADRHDGVSYLDVQEALYARREADVFIDSCCHLSLEGSRVQADTLIGHLENIGMGKRIGLALSDNPDGTSVDARYR